MTAANLSIRPLNQFARNSRCPICQTSLRVRYRPRSHDHKCYRCKVVW